LRLKGLSLGKDEMVCYMDSYMAANMLLSGFVDYDVLIVDECDSGKGCTGFLSEVKTPSKVLIRMSASHGRSNGGPSSSFQVTEVNEMPDVRQGTPNVARFVTTYAKGRTLVMAPDADVAAEMAALIPGAKLVTAKVPLGRLARTMTDKASTAVFITDEMCSRGLNLNLDMVFDCQLVAELGVVRNLTPVELYQRRNRVGRNRAGYYYSPALPTMDPLESDADVMRSNVVREFVSIPQCGRDTARVSAAEAVSLLLSEEEPYVVQTRTADDSHMLLRSSPSGSGSGTSSESFVSKSSTSSRHKRTDELPSWLLWAATATGKSLGGTGFSISPKGLHRSSFSSDEDGTNQIRGVAAALLPRAGVMAPKRYKHVSADAPLAVTRRASGTVQRFEAPRSPPIMDLSASEYELDWPSLLGDLMERCSDMPTIVPPHGWQHTTVGGLGSDWVRRIEVLATSAMVFSAEELELVCRAWNTVVAGTWVKKSPGLSAYAHRDQLEFCLRYFQSYFNLAIMG